MGGLESHGSAAELTTLSHRLDQAYSQQLGLERPRAEPSPVFAG